MKDRQRLVFGIDIYAVLYLKEITNQTKDIAQGSLPNIL